MNNEEAKFILSAYRADGRDANDSHFAAALEQARWDPVLGAWFKDAQEFDSAVARSLRAVRPPADLRAAILVGAEASRPTRWRMRTWAIAAIVALCAGLLGIWMANRQPAQTAFADWQEAALHFLENAPKLDHHSPRAEDLRNWLRSVDSPVPSEFPESLATLKALGCKTLEVAGGRVSVICFHRRDGKLIHLVVFNLPADSALSETEPLFKQRGDWTTASWTKGSEAFMLITEGKPVDLAQYL